MTITTCSDFLLFVWSYFFYTVVCFHVKDLMREHEKPHAILTCFSLFFSRVINWGKLIFFSFKKTVHILSHSSSRFFPTFFVLSSATKMFYYLQTTG